MVPEVLKNSIYLSDASSDFESSLNVGSRGYVASVDGKGNVITTEINDNSTIVDYNEIKKGVLKNR